MSKTDKELLEFAEVVSMNSIEKTDEATTERWKEKMAIQYGDRYTADSSADGTDAEKFYCDNENTSGAYAKRCEKQCDVCKEWITQSKPSAVTDEQLQKEAEEWYMQDSGTFALCDKQTVIRAWKAAGRKHSPATQDKK